MTLFNFIKKFLPWGNPKQQEENRYRTHNKNHVGLGLVLTAEFNQLSKETEKVLRSQIEAIPGVIVQHISPPTGNRQDLSSHSYVHIRLADEFYNPAKGAEIQKIIGELQKTPAVQKVHGPAWFDVEPGPNFKLPGT